MNILYTFDDPSAYIVKTDIPLKMEEPPLTTSTTYHANSSNNNNNNNNNNNSNNNNESYHYILQVRSLTISPADHARVVAACDALCTAYGRCHQLPRRIVHQLFATQQQQQQQEKDKKEKQRRQQQDHPMRTGVVSLDALWPLTAPLSPSCVLAAAFSLLPLLRIVSSTPTPPPAFASANTAWNDPHPHQKSECLYHCLYESFCFDYVHQLKQQLRRRSSTDNGSQPLPHFSFWERFATVANCITFEGADESPRGKNHSTSHTIYTSSSSYGNNMFSLHQYMQRAYRGAAGPTTANNNNNNGTASSVHSSPSKEISFSAADQSRDSTAYTYYTPSGGLRSKKTLETSVAVWSEEVLWRLLYSLLSLLAVVHQSGYHFGGQLTAEHVLCFSVGSGLTAQLEQTISSCVMTYPPPSTNNNNNNNSNVKAEQDAAPAAATAEAEAHQKHLHDQQEAQEVSMLLQTLHDSVILPRCLIAEHTAVHHTYFVCAPLPFSLFGPTTTTTTTAAAATTTTVDGVDTSVDEGAQSSPDEATQHQQEDIASVGHLLLQLLETQRETTAQPPPISSEYQFLVQRLAGAAEEHKRRMMNSVAHNNNNNNNYDNNKPQPPPPPHVSPPVTAAHLVQLQAFRLRITSWLYQLVAEELYLHLQKKENSHGFSGDVQQQQQQQQQKQQQKQQQDALQEREALLREREQKLETLLELYELTHEHLDRVPLAAAAAAPPTRRRDEGDKTGKEQDDKTAPRTTSVDALRAYLLSTQTDEDDDKAPFQKKHPPQPQPQEKDMAATKEAPRLRTDIGTGVYATTTQAHVTASEGFPTLQVQEEIEIQLHEDDDDADHIGVNNNNNNNNNNTSTLHTPKKQTFSPYLTSTHGDPQHADPPDHLYYANSATPPAPASSHHHQHEHQPPGAYAFGAHDRDGRASLPSSVHSSSPLEGEYASLLASANQSPAAAAAAQDQQHRRSQPVPPLPPPAVTALGKEDWSSHSKYSAMSSQLSPANNNNNMHVENPIHKHVFRALTFQGADAAAPPPLYQQLLQQTHSHSTRRSSTGSIEEGSNTVNNNNNNRRSPRVNRNRTENENWRQQQLHAMEQLQQSFQQLQDTYLHTTTNHPNQNNNNNNNNNNNTNQGASVQPYSRHHSAQSSPGGTQVKAPPPPQPQSPQQDQHAVVNTDPHLHYSSYSPSAYDEIPAQPRRGRSSQPPPPSHPIHPANKSAATPLTQHQPTDDHHHNNTNNYNASIGRGSALASVEKRAKRRPPTTSPSPHTQPQPQPQPQPKLSPTPSQLYKGSKAGSSPSPRHANTNPHGSYSPAALGNSSSTELLRRLRGNGI